MGQAAVVALDAAKVDVVGGKCGVATDKFNVGGEMCPTFNDEHHSKIRARCKVPDNFLQNFDFSKMKGGGGKGGNPMAFTADRLYIVKEIDGASTGCAAERLFPPASHPPRAHPRANPSPVPGFVGSPDGRE